MIGLEVLLYTFVCGVMFTLSIMGLESSAVTPSLDRWNRRFFTSLFGVLAISSTTFFLEMVAYLYPDLIVLERIAYFLQGLLYVVPIPMLMVYLLRSSGEEWKGNPLFSVMLALAGVYFILICVSQFTSFFYSITPDNQLHLTPAYPLLVVPVLIMLILLLAAVVRRRDKLSPQYYRAFLFCLVPLVFALVIHLFMPSFLLVNIGLVISVFAMYRVIVLDSIEQDRRQQEEIANQRASIAVLQMRPHFIYNTMTSIYYLCDQDPQRAKQVTMDFSTYLRRIFTAISNVEPIAFTEELEHTRAYLAVEQAQYEDDLVISYDTPHTKFRVPPLTLQPIVENAVKHAMDLDSGPLHIWIQTKETDSGSEIIVGDNGPGFDPAIADEPHTTLANIRHRLAMMCGGTIEFAPRESGGTVVKITVPRQDKKN